MQCIGRTKTLRRCKNDTKRLFCANHKFQPLLWLATLIAIASGLLGLYRGAFEPLINAGKQQITVSPHQITPTLDTWKNYHSFLVSNPTEKAAYAVWVQISTEEKRTRNDRINVDCVIRSSDGRSFVLPHEVDTPPDAVLILGKSAGGLPSLFLVIRSLSPKSSLGFEILAKSRAEVDSKSVNIKYILDILTSSDVPDRFKIKDKDTMMFFDKMPKGLTVNALDEHYVLILESHSHGAE